MNKSIRVLLVDDEERYVRNLGKILQNRGFDVSTALNGYQAIENIKFKGRFDVAVLDINMPVLIREKMAGIIRAKDIFQYMERKI